ncbi:hypothetical protein [Latilactobacillus curvatus]|nr:hypothetical protein [Latilactobacillus curvatus]
MIDWKCTQCGKSGSGGKVPRDGGFCPKNRNAKGEMQPHHFVQK